MGKTYRGKNRKVRVKAYVKIRKLRKIKRSGR